MALQNFHIVVCGSLVPDPLQVLEPLFVNGSGGVAPALKNELMLPVILDPWAAHALYEGAHLQKKVPGSKLWLVSLGPKAKLQQLMMTVAQKASFELVAVDGPAGGFYDSFDAAEILAEAIRGINGLDMSKLFLFGGWSSASRGSGTTMQFIGERLGVVQQFQGVDELVFDGDESFRVLERIEGGKHQVSEVSSPPVLIGWATGNLPEPPNNPQIGMANMRGILPALGKAKKVDFAAVGDATKLLFSDVHLPTQRRETRVVKDMSIDEMAHEIVAWIRG